MKVSGNDSNACLVLKHSRHSRDRPAMGLGAIYGVAIREFCWK